MSYSTFDKLDQYQGNSPWCYSVQRAESFNSDQPVGKVTNSHISVNLKPHSKVLESYGPGQYNINGCYGPGQPVDAFDKWLCCWDGGEFGFCGCPPEYESAASGGFRTGDCVCTHKKTGEKIACYTACEQNREKGAKNGGKPCFLGDEKLKIAGKTTSAYRDDVNGCTLHGVTTCCPVKGVNWRNCAVYDCRDTYNGWFNGTAYDQGHWYFKGDCISPSGATPCTNC